MQGIKILHHYLQLIAWSAAVQRDVFVVGDRVVHLTLALCICTNKNFVITEKNFSKKE